MTIAECHNLRVVEDCAHSLGATFRGRPVGTFGDAAFFSFQTLKPLNCYGGGMAVVRDGALAGRVRERTLADPWPDQKRVENRLLVVLRWTISFVTRGRGARLIVQRSTERSPGS